MFFFYISIHTIVKPCLGAQSAVYRPSSLCPHSEGSSRARLTKSLSEQARGLKTHVSLEACPPLAPPCLSFSPPDPPTDPFVEAKGSRSLDPANYRVLTSAWLSPKCWGTFLQLGDSLRVCVCVCVCALCVCCFYLNFCTAMYQEKESLFYWRHKSCLTQCSTTFVKSNSSTFQAFSRCIFKLF